MILLPVLRCLLFLVSGWKLLSTFRLGSTWDRTVVIRLLGWSSATLATAATALYGFASLFYSTYFMRDRVCDYAGNFDLLPVSKSHLPLSTKCPRGDAVVEIVPAWINPVLLGMFLASMAFAVAAVVTQRFRLRQYRSL
ncbi:hypothetical protein ACN3XK_74605 [Actinomadura welshii]